jgi:hypothetical protein
LGRITQKPDPRPTLIMAHIFLRCFSRVFSLKRDRIPSYSGTTSLLWVAIRFFYDKKSIIRHHQKEKILFYLMSTFYSIYFKIQIENNVCWPRLIPALGSFPVERGWTTASENTFKWIFHDEKLRRPTGVYMWATPKPCIEYPV